MALPERFGGGGEPTLLEGVLRGWSVRNVRAPTELADALPRLPRGAIEDTIAEVNWTGRTALHEAIASHTPDKLILAVLNQDRTAAAKRGVLELALVHQCSPAVYEELLDAAAPGADRALLLVRKALRCQARAEIVLQLLRLVPFSKVRPPTSTTSSNPTNQPR